MYGAGIPGKANPLLPQVPTGQHTPTPTQPPHLRATARSKTPLLGLLLSRITANPPAPRRYLFQVGFGGFSGLSCALCTVTASGVGWKTKRLSRSWRNPKHLEKPKCWARFLHGQQILTLFLLCLLSLSSSSPPLPSMDSSIHPSPAVCPTQPQTMFVVTISLLISATARVTRLQPLSTGEPPGRARRQPSLQC